MKKLVAAVLLSLVASGALAQNSPPVIDGIPNVAVHLNSLATGWALPRESATQTKRFRKQSYKQLCVITGDTDMLIKMQPSDTAPTNVSEAFFINNASGTSGGGKEYWFGVPAGVNLFWRGEAAAGEASIWCW